MTDFFKLHGDFQTIPVSAARGVDPQVASPIDERFAVSQKAISDVQLTDDAPVDVDMSNLAEASVVIIKSDHKVRARLTSTDGSQQAVPVDGLLILVCRAVGVSAIDLTRLTGVDTNCKIFLAKKAP